MPSLDPRREQRGETKQNEKEKRKTDNINYSADIRFKILKKKDFQHFLLREKRGTYKVL